MKLLDYMDASMIVTDLVAAGRGEVLQVMVAQLVAAGKLADGADALRRLEEREQLRTTGIGGGIAIPHARTPEVSRSLVAMGRSREGVPFDAEDGAPVHLLFLILGPPESSTEHVKVLSRIARLVKQREFLNDCAAAGSEADLLALVGRYQD